MRAIILNPNGSQHMTADATSEQLDAAAEAMGCTWLPLPEELSLFFSRPRDPNDIA